MKLKRLIAWSAIVAAGPALAQGNAAAGDAGDEIVVTALKRATVLERTAAAITVLSAADLNPGGGAGLGDLAALAPNVAFSSNIGATQIYIRGIGNPIIVPGADPGVAFYGDGAYISDQFATATSFFDISRVEVLRGPQGALYGRNATGGAVSVVSNAPTAELAGKVDAYGGDYGQRGLEGYLSGPLIGRATARLSYQFRHVGGYTRNLLADTPGAPDRLDDLDSQAVRAQVLVPVGNDGKLKLIGTFYRESENGPTEKTLNEPSPLPAELLFGTRPSSDDRDVESQIAGFKRKVWRGVGQYDQSLGDVVATLIGSYTRSDLSQVYDQDGTRSSQTVTSLETSGREFNLETRLASEPGGRFDWIVGANYVHFDQSRLQGVDGVLPLGLIAPGLPLDIPFPVAFQTGGDVKTRSVAGFVDTKFHVDDRLTLSAGGRYTSDRKTAREFQVFNGAGIDNAVRGSWSNPSAKLGVDFQMDDNVLLYGSYSRGFKSGAVAVGGFTAPARPETVDNFEIGAKARLFDRRLSISAAAFTSRYKDMQVFNVGELTAILTNAPRADINGFEIEATLRPTKNLTLDASFGFNDARYKEYAAPDLRRGKALVDLAGNRLPLVSRTQLRLGAEYRLDLGGDMVPSARVDYTHRSKFFFSEFNTEDEAQRGYGLVDVSVALTSKDHGWRIYGYVRNLTDRTTINALTVNSPLLGSSRLVNLNPPRRAGVGASFTF